MRGVSKDRDSRTKPFGDNLLGGTGFAQNVEDSGKIVVRTTKRG